MGKMDFNSDDVMFLFGAGVSVPIGIPAMQGMYRAYMDKRKSGISTEDKKTCKFFIREMGVDQDLEEFLLAANSIIGFKDSNLNRFVEKNISRVKTSRKVREYNKKLDSNVKDVVNARKGILDFLSRVCFQFDREMAVKINAGFVDALSKVGYPVYSTNYDYALEYVAIEKNIKINDNFTEKGQRFLWNNQIDFSGQKGFKLIKLHGSVTWYIDGDGTIERIHSNTNINPVGKKVEKIIIVPTRFKDIYAQHFFALYSHFLSSLARARVIIIVGHSLRDDYLRAGIIERKRKGDFQVIIIDPAYPKEIKNELPPSPPRKIGDFIHLPYKWEEFSNEISSIILNFPSNQIVEKCINVLKKDKYKKNKLKIKGNVGVLKVSGDKELTIDLDVYLAVNDKPSRLRAWLEASFTDTEGKIKNEITTEFIEIGETFLGEGLSGLVKTTKTLKIKIPKIEDWLREGYKVSLIVGLVRSHVKESLNPKRQNLIVKDSKVLSYKE